MSDKVQSKVLLDVHRHFTVGELRRQIEGQPDDRTLCFTAIGEEVVRVRRVTKRHGRWVASKVV